MIHPGSCTIDTIFRTSKKRKVCFTLNFLDDKNNTFNGARAFILNA